MLITLSFITKTKQYDFQVNPEQRIIDVLQTIHENSDMKIHMDRCTYIRSIRKKEMVNTLMTFHQAKIFPGDKLILEEM